MAEQETIADIAAEKRRIAKEVRDHASNGDYWDKKKANETAEDLEEEADRLEAAHKREIYEAERRANHAAMKNVSETLSKVGPLYDAESIGNAAKLREALSKFCAYSAVVLNAGMFNRVHLEALLSMANAALSAPPRNCDRFGGDNAKLQKVYYSERGKECDPRDHYSRQAYLVGYGNWLLAPATEKEGGVK